MTSRVCALLGAALLLGACETTLPVRGVLEGSDEVFTGSATGNMWDGAGTLTVRSSKGTECTGTFVYIDERQGSGTFICNDKSTGPFEFVSTGMRGTGHGFIGGRRFTFTFGG